MARMSDNYASVELTLNGDACTDEALAFINPEVEGWKSVIWVPRSQIRNLDDVLDGLEDGIRWGTREEVTIEIPIWLVEEQGLDNYAEEMDV